MQNNSFLIIACIKKTLHLQSVLFGSVCLFMLSIVSIAWEDVLVEQTAFKATLQVCYNCISSILEIPILRSIEKNTKNCNTDSSSLWAKLLLDQNKSVSAKEIKSAESLN